MLIEAADCDFHLRELRDQSFAALVETTLRLAPPLTVTGDELDWALERLDDVLAGLL